MWHCIEEEIDYSPGETRVWLDGAEVVDLNRMEATQSSPTGSLFAPQIAYYTTNAIPTYAMWMDDFIIDDKPIGCAK